MPNPNVTIERSVLDRLLRDRRKLRALEAAGVDNWEGYDVAMEQLRASDHDAEDA